MAAAAPVAAAAFVAADAALVAAASVLAAPAAAAWSTEGPFFLLEGGIIVCKEYQSVGPFDGTGFPHRPLSCNRECVSPIGPI